MGWDRERVHRRLLLPVTFAVFAFSLPQLSAGATFSDDFNRKDGPASNGWSNSPGQSYDLVIRGNVLTVPTDVSYSDAGIFRNVGPIRRATISSTVGHQSGCCGTYDAFATWFLFKSSGARDSGYGIIVQRSDNNYSNSSVHLVLDGVGIDLKSSSFQYHSEVDVTVTMRPDGSLKGAVSDSTNVFNFEFPARDLSSLTENNVTIVQSGPDNRNTTFVYPTIDNLTLTYTPEPFLAFPLRGTPADCKPFPCTPFTAQVSAVVDHSGTALDPEGVSASCDAPWGKRCKDAKVTAFNGESSGNGLASCDSSEPKGYPKRSGKDFLLGKLNYVGSRCTGKNDPDPNKADPDHLQYDGHSGYDFPFAYDSTIYAPADGDLRRPTVDSINGACGSTPWKARHTFYIDHKNGYTSWFLHANKLHADVQQKFEEGADHVAVSQGDPIAHLGDFGVKTCGERGAQGHPSRHLHFEVRRGTTEIVDPYQSGLWIK